MPTLAFYPSLLAFLISIGSGIYFIAWWFKTGKEHSFLLYWGLGSGSLLLFKIPNILATAKIEVIQEDLYPFFFITLLLYFLAYFALIRGLAFFTEFPNGGIIAGLLALWFGAAVLYFASSFLIPNIGVANAPVWASHLLFYIPAQVFLLYEVWRVARRPAGPFAIPNTGVAFIVAGMLSLLGSSILYIVTQTGSYPAEFWYFAVISSYQISFLQVMSGILLFFGLRAFAQSYLRTIRQEDRGAM